MRDSDRKIIKVGAAKADRIPASGSKIYVESASFPFLIALGSGNLNMVKSGTELDVGELFDSIQITNPNTTVALQAVIWVGTSRVFFHYPAIPGTALVPYWGTFSGGSVAAPATFTEGGLLTSAGILFPGIATTAVKYSSKGVPEGARRKQFVVTNRHAVDAIYVTTGDLYVFAAVQPTDDYTLETDADIRLHGKTSGNSYYIAEIFYL